MTATHLHIYRFNNRRPALKTALSGLLALCFCGALSVNHAFAVGNSSVALDFNGELTAPQECVADIQGIGDVQFSPVYASDFGSALAGQEIGHRVEFSVKIENCPVTPNNHAHLEITGPSNISNTGFIFTSGNAQARRAVDVNIYSKDGATETKLTPSEVRSVPLVNSAFSGEGGQDIVYAASLSRNKDGYPYGEGAVSTTLNITVSYDF